MNPTVKFDPTQSFEEAGDVLFDPSQSFEEVGDSLGGVPSPSSEPAPKAVSKPVVQKTPAKPKPVAKPEKKPTLTREAVLSFLKKNPRISVQDFDRHMLSTYGIKPDNSKEIVTYFQNTAQNVGPIRDSSPVAKAMPARTWTETFSDSMSEMFDVAGEGLNSFLLRAGLEHREEELIRYWASANNLSGEELDAELARNDKARANIIKERRAKIALRDEAEAAADPSLGGMIKRGSASMLGDLVGDINPTYAIAPGSTAVGRVAAQGGVNAGTDVAVQLGEMSDGIQDEYDYGRTGTNFVAGAAFQGAGELAGSVAPAVSKLVNGKTEEPTPTVKEVNADVIEDVETTGVEIVPDVVERFQQALKDLKPRSKEQEELVSQNRQRQFAGLKEAQEGKPAGRQGFYEQLAAMKGKAEKVDIEDISAQFTKQDLDDLFNIIVADNSLTAGEKLNAQAGLEKLLGAGEGGKVPTSGEMRLLGKVYGGELVQSLMKVRPLKDKTLDFAGNALSLPRTLMSSYDLSAPLRQGGFLIRRKEFRDSWKPMFQAARTEKGYQDIMKTINESPNRQLMEDSGLAITDMDGAFSQREEDFMSSWGDKVPLVRASNRAYSGFLNKLRADTFDDFVAKAAARGNDVRNNPQALEAISAYVNAATGRGNLPKSLEKYGPVLNAMFFSPKLMSSRLNLLFNPKIYTNLPKGTRREALGDLAAYTGTAMTILTTASMAGASVEWDPRSSDFAKIKIGNTRFDILGGFQQYLKLAAVVGTGITKTAKGDLKGESHLDSSFEESAQHILQSAGRFLRSKLSPNASYGVDAYFGENIIGDEFDADMDALKRLFPLFGQDLAEGAYEGYQEDGVTGALVGAAKVTPAVFGVGVSTYDVGTNRYGQDPSTDQDADPASAELNRLSSVLGKDKDVVGYVGPNNLKKFEATDEQVKKYQKVSGQLILESVREAQATDEWKNMTDEERIKEVRSISKDMREIAREELFPEHYGEDALDLTEDFEEVETGSVALEEEAESKGELRFDPDQPFEVTTIENDKASNLLTSKFGVTITDEGVRPLEDQQRYYDQAGGRGVSAPGTSSHEHGNAIDIRTPKKGVTPAKVKKLLESNGYYGVRIITKTHGTGPHWHIQWEGMKE